MTFINILIAGILACFIMDIWQRIVARISGSTPPDWAVVGRWAYELLTKGKLFNAGIEDQPVLSFEIPFGWSVHYIVGFGYALFYWLLVEAGIIGYSWQDGLLFGVISSIVPWLFFLPAIGKGLFARNTSNPVVVCSLALLTHAIYGVALALALGLTLG
jgi:hypothetical protein